MTPSKKDTINPEDAIPPAAPVEPADPIVLPPPLPPMTAGSGKPGKVQAIAIMTLISGITNILWMLVVGGILLSSALVSFGITCLFVPLVIPPIVLGVFEIIYAAKLMANAAKPVKPSQTIAILQIICILTGNPIPLATGILALVFYSQPDVKAYFAQINFQA